MTRRVDTSDVIRGVSSASSSCVATQYLSDDEIYSHFYAYSLLHFFE